MKVILPILPKIGCHGNVPWGIWRTGPDWQHSRKYLPFGEKNRENRSSRTWDSFAQFKKKEKEGKTYSPVRKFAEWAKLGIAQPVAAVEQWFSNFARLWN